MKIGIWLGSDIVDTIGGGGSYSNRFLRLVDNYNFDEEIELCYLTLTDNNKLNRKCINVSQIPALLYGITCFSETLTNFIKRVDKYIIKRIGLSKILKGSDIKIICYYRPTECMDSNFPFISNNWDIGHRSTHAFPEVIVNRTFEDRDIFYKQILPKSLLTICESETGRKELIDYTGLGAHKIRVMPIFAGGVTSLSVSDEKMMSILEKIGVRRLCYFYYPAQFWAHKNHIGLLKAFKEFKKTHENFKLVFSGSDRGNKDYIIEKTQKLGLAKDVIFLGFIPEEDVYSLYKNATCLVMASHFGPTNMPPIEAMELGCPVACSDLGGHREILGDNAVYFDSYDYQSIYHALEEIVNNRESWVDKIVKQKDLTMFNAQFAMKRFNDILKEAIIIRENWG